jgi:hypothetical protein
MTNDKQWHVDDITVLSYIDGDYNCAVELTRGADDELEVEATYGVNENWSVDAATCRWLTIPELVRLESYLNVSGVVNQLLNDALNVYNSGPRS